MDKTRIETILERDRLSSDMELYAYFRKEGLTMRQAKEWVATKRGAYREAGWRPNPIDWRK